jgi:hypothetical protein
VLPLLLVASVSRRKLPECETDSVPGAGCVDIYFYKQGSLLRVE